MSSTHPALIIIDMQRGMASAAAGARNNPDAEQVIRHLVVVGVSTNNSVEATARSAGNLGFRTCVAADATFAFARIDFNGVARTAEDVHAMALANLQGEYATVATAAELLDAL